MTENESKLNELDLARAIRELDKNVQPERDLWQGIERQILDHPQPDMNRPKRDWMPFAVAASLFIAVSAMMLNVAQLNSLDQFGSETVAWEQMQREHLLVRNPMVEEFNRTNQRLDQETREELFQSIDVIEQARWQLQEELRKDPDNHQLMKMLMNVHEQELELLRQDYSRVANSM